MNLTNSAPNAAVSRKLEEQFSSAATRSKERKASKTKRLTAITKLAIDAGVKVLDQFLGFLLLGVGEGGIIIEIRHKFVGREKT